MVEHSVPDLPGEIKSLTTVLKTFHNPYALNIVAKIIARAGRKCPLTDMSKWRMSQVMSQRYRLRQILVKPE